MAMNSLMRDMRTMVIAAGAALAVSGTLAAPASAGPFGTAVPGGQCITEGERADLMRETWRIVATMEREVWDAVEAKRARIEAACVEGGAEADWCRRIVSAGDPAPASVEAECLEDGMAPESCVSVGGEERDGDEWTAK